MDTRTSVASIDAVDIGFDFDMTDGGTDGKETGTKEDCPHLSIGQYADLMTGDPEEIEQARIPDEFPFAKRLTGTKEDCPELSRKQYDDMMNGDPEDIVQARIPDEPLFPKQLTGTKEDLPNLSSEKYDDMMNGNPDDIMQARIPDENPFAKPATKEDCPYLPKETYDAMMSGDPEEITQARIPEENPFQKPIIVNASLDGIDLGFDSEEPEGAPQKPIVVNASLDGINLGFDSEEPEGAPQKPLSGTKEDCPHLSRDEYNDMMTGDPHKIVQARIPEECPFIMPDSRPQTKEDLPNLTPAEYDAMSQRDPYSIEQARVPDINPFKTEHPEPADQPTAEQNNLTDPESPIKVSSIQNDKEEVDEFDFELPAKLPTATAEEEADEFDFDMPAKPLPEPKVQEEPKPPVSTKEDIPHLTPSEYDAMNQGDPNNIEQARIPDECPFNVEQLKKAESEAKSPLDALHQQGLLPTQPQITGFEAGDPKESEWDNVQQITARFDDPEGVGKKEPVVETTPLITYDETVRYFETKDLSKYKAQIKTSVTRHGFSAFCYSLFGPPKLHKDLCAERDRAFCTAACPFDNEDPLHFRVLTTVYRRLTGSKLDPQRFGSHWDQIGFQGNDPASDLRGTGFLGLIHLLYLVMDPKTYPLARDIYKLSHHEQQNFPMALMSINITRLAIQSLREDVLNKECNKRHQVMQTLSEFYAGSFLKMYTIWKQQHKSIADSGFVIKDVETWAKKNPKGVLADLEQNLEQRRKQAPVTGSGEEPLHFQAVCDFEEDDE